MNPSTLLLRRGGAAALTRFLVRDPAQVARTLERVAASGPLQDHEIPNVWQIAVGVLRMHHRLLYRSETVGVTQTQAPRPGWRAKVLTPRPLRFPFLLWEGSVVPGDLSGLASPPDVIARHLLGTHHDGLQFVYDFQLLDLWPGAIDRLWNDAKAVVDAGNGTRRARWLRDLAVFEGYHEGLFAALNRWREGAAVLDEADRNNPDMSLWATLRWCARQPDTPGTTLAAIRRGQIDWVNV